MAGGAGIAGRHITTWARNNLAALRQRAADFNTDTSPAWWLAADHASY